MRYPRVQGTQLSVAGSVEEARDVSKPGELKIITSLSFSLFLFWKSSSPPGIPEIVSSVTSDTYILYSLVFTSQEISSFTIVERDILREEYNKSTGNVMYT